jgi:glycogen debranching enzyme
LARGVLGFLAQQQARHLDPASDAEPGKILHESRLGEMAALKEVPFAQYYGSVDATPLFLILACDYLQRTADQAFVAELKPALDAAMAWIRQAESREKDGFLRYSRAAEGGLRNQGWKDSDDAVHHADGRLAEGSIALCEVQAYSYGARLAMAAIQRQWGNRAEADQLLAEAAKLRRRFEKAFWCEEIGTYALAIDGVGEPCCVRSSNAGHCLWTGIASPEAASSIARQLLLGKCSAETQAKWLRGTRQRDNCERLGANINNSKRLAKTALHGLMFNRFAKKTSRSLDINTAAKCFE